MGLILPFVPGHGTSDEVLAALLNPITSIEWINLTVSAVSQLLTPRPSRKTVLFWINNIPDHAGLWINLGGTTAVINEGLKLTGGVFGLDIADSVPISMIAQGGDIDICVIQFGGGG